MPLKRITGKFRLLRSSCETKSKVNCLFPRVRNFFLPKTKPALLHLVWSYIQTLFTLGGTKKKQFQLGPLSIVSHNDLIDFALWKSGRRRHLNKKIVWFCCFALERSFIWNKVNETIPDRLEMIKNRFYLEGSLT